MLGKLLEEMSLSVTQLNEYVAKLLEQDEAMQSLFVVGEISNFKRHSSGHLYFSLKDEKSSVRCVMFRQQAGGLSFAPSDGMQVMVGGYASLYPRDGSFQVYAQSMQQQGQGDLYQRFEQLKTKLQGLGWFDAERKRPIPMLPGRIGVVTSPTGAVIRDIIHVSTRRNPQVNLLLYPAKVQGDGAAQEIAAGIAYFNARDDIDVIIIGRGGGSMEDLWAFNEEATAQAIYQSNIPIISAVGHETDYTIADFAADLRAPTPSAAAELAVPLLNELYANIDALLYAAKLALRRPLVENRLRLDAVLSSALFQRPRQALLDGYKQVEVLDMRMKNSHLLRYGAAKNALDAAAGNLQALSPMGILRRGYAYVQDAVSKENIASIAGATIGREVNITFADGVAGALMNGQVYQKDDENG
ncbi:exodeoxyribonuclease VII large subunit [Eubacteriales bacterium OttesenSCG-928-N14]|nr:exodeoxyribonuclease VII large subunit [Eubacteriales bacterium OttesenSCG-928-N14]